MRILRGKILAVVMSLIAASVEARGVLALEGKWGVAWNEWGSSNVVWRTFKTKVPADWEGRRVRVEIPGALHKCDAVVWVNGEKAGDILRPGFDGVEATRLVRFGEENEIRFCITESGAETERGATKAVTKVHRAAKGPDGAKPRLVAYPEAFISDVFANTSWREKKCDFEVEIDWGENLAQRRRDAEIFVEVFDASSNVVWNGELKVALNPGRSVHTLSMPWDDRIISWELGRPALYTANVKLRNCGDSYSIRFGFREVWREGKEIMMNGHKLHLRPVYGFGAMSSRPGLKFLQGIGFNAAFFGHSNDAVGIAGGQKVGEFGFAGESPFAAADELGMGIIATVGAYDTLGADVFHKDPSMRAEFERFSRITDRQVRNSPSLLVGIIGNMTKCDSGWTMANMGQRKATGDRAAQIELARQIHRESNPNILYMSHADGAVADIDSGNVYLNWTPIQEQEEWLCQWATNGTMPWCSAEFLAPYPGDFVKKGVFSATERLAAFYGDRAYLEEPEELLSRAAEANATAKLHGSAVGGKLLRAWPLYWDLRREWTWRNNSRWRAFGLNGGNMWFNIGEGYGTPPGYHGPHLQRYGAISDEAEGKPAWANEGWDIHRLGNLDFCGFIGGAPDFADRTHAYYAGEKIEKQLVMIWDGVGEKAVKAAWKVETGAGKTLCASASLREIKQGEQARVPISFVAPDVKEKMSCRISATFTGDGIEPFTDSFDFEVWPGNQGTGNREQGGRLKLSIIDPLGEVAGVLDALGVKYGKIKKVADLPADATHLVIGRDALTGISIDSLAPRVERGLRVFVMRQTSDTWRKMGFRVQDLMLREVFARDIAFKNLPEDALRYWRGTPDYPNAPFGRVMSHATQRGPRGTRRHTVAGLVLQIPERVGYVPMIVGGFDLNYAALLRFEAGGDVTYCTLDFEGRVGVDPGATETAKAVFGEFLGNVKLWKCGNMEICKCGNGERLKNFELIVCDEEWAKAEGFIIGAETNILRAAIPDCAAFRGVGLGDVRWPSGLAIKPLRGDGATPDGAFAVKRKGDKTLVFSQIPEGQFAGRAAKRDQKKEWPIANAERLDEGRVRRMYARLRTNCEQGTGNGERGTALRELKKALHKSGGAEYETLPAMHLLGPFSAGKDDSKLMLDTVWSAKGEKMAIEGDFDPNHEFPLPQGGTANWRPMLAPNAEGVFDFATAETSASFPVTYAICHVERKAAGDAILKLGGDWRFRVWCNGKEVFRTESGARIARFEVRVSLKAGDNMLAFKVGAGSSGHKLIALLSSERGDDAYEEHDAELDSMTLYDDDVMGFDPYEFHYW